MITALFSIFEQSPMAGFLVTLLAKGFVLLTVCAVLVRFLKRSSASARHAVWIMGLCAMALLPLGAVFLPQKTLWLPATDPAPGDFGFVQPVSVEEESLPHPSAHFVSHTADSSEVSPGAGHSTSFTIRADDVLLVTWMAGMVVLLLMVGMAGRRLRSLRRNSPEVTGAEWRPLLEQCRREIGLRRLPEVRAGSGTGMPMTWGIFRPVILLPEASFLWSPSRCRIVLLHEMAHVKRRDSLFQLVMRLVCAIHWYNPFVWVALRSSILEREKACDELVLGSGVVKGSEYATHLLEIVGRSRRHGSSALLATAMAGRGDLAIRLKAILEPRGPGRRFSGAGVYAAGAVLCGALVTIAPLQAEREISDSPARAAADSSDDFSDPRIENIERFLRERRREIDEHREYFLRIFNELDPSLGLGHLGSAESLTAEVRQDAIGRAREALRALIQIEPGLNVLDIDRVREAVRALDEVEEAGELKERLERLWAISFRLERLEPSYDHAKAKLAEFKAEHASVPPGEGWQFRSVSTIRGETQFSLHHPEKDISFWESVGGRRHGLEILRFDRDTNQLAVRYEEENLLLTLSEGARETRRPVVQGFGQRDDERWKEIWADALEASPELREIVEEMLEVQKELSDFKEREPEIHRALRDLQDPTREERALSSALGIPLTEVRGASEQRLGDELRRGAELNIKSARYRVTVRQELVRIVPGLAEADAGQIAWRGLREAQSLNQPE